MVETGAGDLITAWFHGSGERQSDDVLIQGARKRQGENTWSPPFVMADTQDLPDCNPVLFIDPRGVLWLFWVAIQNNEWGGALLKCRTATRYTDDGPPRWDWQDVIHTRPKDLEARFLAVMDNAETAMAALLEATPRYRDLIAQGRRAAQDKLTRRLGWMTRIHPLMTSDTRMVLGLYSDVFNCSLACITEDWGKTWVCSEPILAPEAKLLANIQPSFVRKRNGDLMAFMRDNGMPKNIRTAISGDNGMTWQQHGMLDVRNPGSSVECVALDSGRWVLVCNDTLRGRHILSAYLSEDEGATWPLFRRIEDFKPGKGSGSYPSVIQAADGAIHCTYSFKEEGVKGSSIKHVRFNEAWVMAAPQPSPAE